MPSVKFVPLCVPVVSEPRFEDIQANTFFIDADGDVCVKMILCGQQHNVVRLTDVNNSGETVITYKFDDSYAPIRVINAVIREVEPDC